MHKKFKITSSKVYTLNDYVQDIVRKKNAHNIVQVQFPSV